MQREKPYNLFYSRIFYLQNGEIFVGAILVTDKYTSHWKMYLIVEIKVFMVLFEQENCIKSGIIFKRNEIISHENYIEVIFLRTKVKVYYVMMSSISTTPPQYIYIRNRDTLDTFFEVQSRGNYSFEM